MTHYYINEYSFYILFNSKPEFEIIPGAFIL